MTVSKAILEIMKKTPEKALISILTLALLGSCTTGRSKDALESEWSHLTAVTTLKCKPWPLKESELDVSYMAADATQNGGFVAGIRLRNGSRMPVFAKTEGSVNLSADDLIPLPIGYDAFVLAPLEVGSGALAFVIQNKKDRAWLEVRSIKDNQLAGRMATSLPMEAETGRLVSVSNGWWLQVNHSDEEASYVFVSVSPDAKWQFNISSFQSRSRYASLVGNQNGTSAYVIENARSSKDANVSNFSITSLDPSGSFKSTVKFSLPTKGGMESWSTTMLDKRLMIASVRGDSMVGQGVLLVASLDPASSPAQIIWQKEFPFADVHVGEPVWLSNGNQGFVTLMQWVDSEGVLSRVKVDGAGATQLPDVGVFERGAILASGYLGPKDGVGAFRYREKDLWKYKLCKLSL